MAKILLLPPALINQIAAGEVIERPASVVKEIVENAIDAGATRLALEIEAAGSKLIRLSDNGSGIEKEDLALAFTTHATSKIRTLEDLEQVSSLGFRGEALASIASISKTTLTSCTQSSDHAWKISPHLNENITPAAHPQGTTIEIRDLFYNTPARKKFLRSDRTERYHITQLLAGIALSRAPFVITLHEQGRKILEYGGKTLKESLKSVMGDEFLAQSIEIQAEHEGMHLHGWVGLPTYTHQQTDKQYFFVNQRLVSDKLVAHAIKQAYEDMIHRQRHPIFVLFLTLDPALVDVNAHPSKREVRFRQAQLTHDFMFSSLHRALRNIQPRVAQLTPLSSASPKLPESTTATAQPHHKMIPHTFARPPRLQETKAYYQWAQTPPPAVTSAPQPEIEKINLPLGQALGQIHGTFIVAENAQGLVVVDMHAAHERILYEQFKSVLKTQKQIPVQRLLLPLPLTLTPVQQDSLAQHGAWLKTLGFDWTINDKEFTLLTVPARLKNSDCISIIGDVLQELSEFPKSTQLQRAQEQIIANMCCHQAVRAHDLLSISEMNQLLRDLETTPAAGQCNHGRPTWIQLDATQLDALFLRGQ